MKLSELSTDRTADVLCELTPYIDNIVSDEEIVSQIGTAVNNDRGLNRYGLFLVGMEKISKTVPLLLKTHRADVYGILSIMNEKSVEEIASQKFSDTLKQIKEVMQDEDLISFFKPSAQQGGTEQSAPSVASPASE